VVGWDAGTPGRPDAEHDGRPPASRPAAMTDRPSVASLSNRTPKGTLRQVPAVAASGGVMSGSVRGIDVMEQTTRSARKSLSRETTNAGRRLSQRGR
jgi:hypothetical protein